MVARKEKIWFDASAVALLALMAALAGGAALRQSTAFDEPAHIGAGISCLQKLDLRLNEEHPPLSKVLAAAPLVASGVRTDYSSPAWTISESFFPAYGLQWVFGELILTRWNDPAVVLFWARLPMLLLTLAFGCMIYVYASRLGGPWGGLLCVCLFITTPAFLAFGPLVVNDIAIALFCLWTAWALGDMWQTPSRKNATTLGLALAGAMLTKFSAGILLIVVPALAFSARWMPFPEQPAAKLDLRKWRRLRRRKAGLALLVAAATVYAAYFVLSWGQPTSALNRLGDGVYTEPLRRLLMPPWLYLRGLLFTAVASSRPTFILGQHYDHGVWFYFPFVLLLKSAPGFLALLAMGAVTALWRRGKRAIPANLRAHWRAQWISLAVFTTVLLLARLNISVRHLSVPLALMILLLAPLPHLLRPLWSRALVALLTVTCLVTAIRAYPYYIPYTNALAMNRPAYELLNDSNVDWNQGLLHVKQFAAERGIRIARVDTYSLSDPAPFLPGAGIWDCQAPLDSDAGSWVAISANAILDAHNCGWLLRYPHESIAGGSMYVVHLPDRIPPPGTLGGPPRPSDRRMFMGAPIDIRTLVQYLARRPDTIPATMADMEKRFSESRRP